MPLKKIMNLTLSMLLLTVILLGTNIRGRAEEFDCAQNKHNYAEIENKPPTETESGHITYKCQLCGEVTKRILYATGHKWSEWVTEKEPSCTSPGRRVRTCNVGTKHTEIEEIPATEHRYVEKITEPNCKDAGKKLYTCSICGDSYTEAFGAPGGHNYNEALSKEPSCAHEGIKTFTCDGCGGSYTETIPALGHNYGEWIIDIPPGEGTTGGRHKECTLCGERISETVSALPVSEPEAVPEEKPFFGITEAVVTGANITLWGILFFILFGEFGFLFWVKRKKKEIKEQERFAYSGEDGFRLL